MQHVERNFGAKNPLRKLRRAAETSIKICIICTGVDWICVYQAFVKDLRVQYDCLTN